jgi:hypothetical protein
LRTIEVRPAQQIELAGMALTVVEAAIADGRARQGIRDLAGWVVYLLRQRRDHGWAPPPPAESRRMEGPRPDAPEVLGAYFAQLATEQGAGRVPSSDVVYFYTPNAATCGRAAAGAAFCDRTRRCLPAYTGNAVPARTGIETKDATLTRRCSLDLQL